MPEENETKSAAGSITDELAVFRALDVLWGTNQACSETVHQLRLAHLYQLRKDEQSFRQKAIAVLIFLIVLIPSLSSLIDNQYLKVGWGLALIFLGSLYIWAAHDRLAQKEIEKEYENIEVFDSIVQRGKLDLLRDYIFSYCNRHEVLYQIYPRANALERTSLMGVLDSYQKIFKTVSTKLLDLRDNESKLFSREDYDVMIGYIEFCKGRYAKLNNASNRGDL